VGKRIAFARLEHPTWSDDALRDFALRELSDLGYWLYIVEDVP
jgi:hypothetical protein